MILEHLFEKLARNGESDIYPYHMPGHKRNGWGGLPPELYRIDITEIDGFDNLHQPEGILKALQDKAAALCGAEESFYLVNGSTGGILSAISAALPPGGRILMARNCHKSAYHAAYLRNLKISYLYPEVLKEYDIFEAVTPEQVEAVLEKESRIGAVLIVSPTYEGRIANIRRIAETVHEKGIPLIVDEAHGAHLGLSTEVHENSCRQGADIVIQSVHKTLPALTQAALLHVNGNLVDRDLLKRFLHIYQSSSPSYLLMASIDNALRHAEDGVYAFRTFRERYGEMMEKLHRCRCLKFLPIDREKQDLGKLVISVKDTALSGKQLYGILLDEYRLQLEMAAESYVLAMFTVNDRQEGYDRMVHALLEIDDRLSAGDLSKALSQTRRKGLSELGIQGMEWPSGLPLTVAWDGEKEEIPFGRSVGRYVGEFVNLYPPGIPLLVPGEIMTEELNQRIQAWLHQGLTVQGIGEQEGKHFIKVLRDRKGKDY